MDRPDTGRWPMSPRFAFARPAGPAPSFPLLWRSLWPDLRPYAAGLAAALAASAAAPALEAAGIWVFKRVVDEVLVPHALARLPPLAAMLTVLVAADAAAGAVERLLAAWATERFLVALRTRVFRHLLALPLATLERRPAGDLMARLESDSGVVAGFLRAGACGAVADALRVVFFAGALLWLDLLLGIVALCVVPLFALAVRRFSRRIREAARDERRHIGGASAVAQEGLSAVALVQSFDRQDVVSGRFASEAEAGLRAHLAGTRLRAMLSPVLDLVDLAGGLAIVALGTWALSLDRLTLGGLLAFIAYLNKLYGPVRSLGSFASQIWPAAAAAERIHELLTERPASTGAAAGGRRRFRGAVTFEAVRFRHPGAQADTLRGLSFHLEPGRVLALVGRSGAGKTTIARLLLRLYEPTEGAILVDGVDVRDLPVPEVRAAVALVPQETVLFHASVRENIAFGRLDASDDEVRRAAAEAGADRFIRDLPAGYDTVIGERGMRLSGGQRQRIALARALVRQAPILILDEPTAGLDALSARRVLSSALRASSKRCVLVITHDVNAIGAADEILVLEAGEVVARGRHGDLSARPGLYASLRRATRVRAGGEG